MKQMLLVAAIGLAAMADATATMNISQAAVLAADPSTSLSELSELPSAITEVPTDTWQSMEAAITNLMLGKSAFGATPMGGSVKKIKHLITKDMMPKVLTAHKADQRQLNKLAADIAKCGKLKDNGVRAAAPSKGKYTSSGRSHKSCRKDEAIKLMSLRTCRQQERALLQIKKLKCNYFASVSRKWGFSKNNNIIVRKSGGESVLAYITRLSVTFCGDHIHCSKGQCSKPGGWGGGLPNGMLDKYLKAKHACEVATRNYNNKVKECKRKQRAYNIKKKKCDQFQAIMDHNSCKTAVIVKDACEAYAGCYYPKVKVFKDFVRRTRYMEQDRKAEWRGLKRMDCLIDAFADGKVTNKEVDACKKRTVNTRVLNLRYPRIQPLKKCQLPTMYPATGAYKRREFKPLPVMAKGMQCAPCAGIDAMGTKPRPGSPKSARCSRISLA